MNNKTNRILGMLLILAFIIVISYLAGFYRGMNECKKIYQEYKIKEN